MKHWLAYAFSFLAFLTVTPLAFAAAGNVTQLDLTTFRVDNALSGMDCNYTWGTNGTVDLNDTLTLNQRASGQYGTCTDLGAGSFKISYSQWTVQPTNGETLQIYYNKNSVATNTRDFTYSTTPPAPNPSVTQLNATTFRVDHAANGMDCSYTWGTNGTVDVNDPTTLIQIASGQYGTCTDLGAGSFKISYSQWTVQPTNGETLQIYFNKNNLTQVTNNFTYSSRSITALDPATVYISKALLDIGVKFDLKAEVYKDTTLVSSGKVNSVNPGIGATLEAISFNSFSPVFLPFGSALKVQVYARNACSGSLLNSGTATLHYNASTVDSRFGATITPAADTTYHLLDSFLLGTTSGSSAKTIAVAAGARCSAFKSFGSWSITP